MSEHPLRITNTDETGNRHLEIDDTISIVDVSPVESDGSSTGEVGRFEIRDEGTLIWSVSYGRDGRARSEAREAARLVAGAYSLGRRSTTEPADR